MTEPFQTALREKTLSEMFSALLPDVHYRTIDRLSRPYCGCCFVEWPCRGHVDRGAFLAALDSCQRDRERMEKLQAWLQSPEDQSRGVEAWRDHEDPRIWCYALRLVDDYGCKTVAIAPTLREAIDLLP